MEGSNTLVCDGDKWNGTVPHCNGKVRPKGYLYLVNIFFS